ncbi:hypothetical protein PSI19_11580 [Xenorhabdus khoisanae]|uniref:hypothetical protein n=1 Tax=Xenorhabdus TaxID=626 RepID=UPI0023593015|nr:hypothetical protein [Xenorhabdus khoisanae]MDC9614503.1 hypothetical protein [Xenorhabdus khoisanae]
MLFCHTLQQVQLIGQTALKLNVSTTTPADLLGVIESNALTVANLDGTISVIAAKTVIYDFECLMDRATR